MKADLLAALAEFEANEMLFGGVLAEQKTIRLLIPAIKKKERRKVHMGGRGGGSWGGRKRRKEGGGGGGRNAWGEESEEIGRRVRERR